MGKKQQRLAQNKGQAILEFVIVFPMLVLFTFALVDVGRAIQHYGPSGGWVKLDGRRFDICAGVHTVSGYSAHADQSDLLRFATGMRVTPQTIRIVHGDNNAKQTLQDLLQARLPECKVVIPGE